MAWPSASSRTKTWGTEILTAGDLDGQFDILHQYNNDQLNGTTGHKHSGGTSDGPQIPLASGVSGILPVANGGTGVSAVQMIGEIKMWSTSTAPSNYNLCDGSAISRTTYATLYALIGTTFGSGDGTTTFNVPDFRGLMPVCQNASDSNFDQLKTPTTYVGEKTHTLLVGEIPGLAYTVAADSGANPSTTSFLGRSGSPTGTFTGTTSGGGGTHNNMPPYMVIQFIIRIQ